MAHDVDPDNVLRLKPEFIAPVDAPQIWDNWARCACCRLWRVPLAAIKLAATRDPEFFKSNIVVCQRCLPGMGKLANTCRCGREFMRHTQWRSEELFFNCNPRMQVGIDMAVGKDETVEMVVVVHQELKVANKPSEVKLSANEEFARRQREPAIVREVQTLMDDDFAIRVSFGGYLPTDDNPGGYLVSTFLLWWEAPGRGREMARAFAEAMGCGSDLERLKGRELYMLRSWGEDDGIEAIEDKETGRVFSRSSFLYPNKTSNEVPAVFRQRFDLIDRWIAANEARLKELREMRERVMQGINWGHFHP